MNRHTLILGLFITIICMPAHATDTGYPNDVELRSLPEYCQVKLRQKPGDAGYNTWLNILGPDFIHTHHFCAGLNFINRHYKARSVYDRKYYLTASLPEFGYMITHAAPTYSLMPDVYMSRATALSKLGRAGEALTDFQKAIQLNPKLPKAYAIVSDYYSDRNLKDKALAMISEGLKQVPDSKMLQRRFLELGGKKPFPEPYIDAVKAEPPSALEQPDKPASAAYHGAADAPTRAQTPPAVEPAPATPPPAIGVPGNPYCRFCPDPAPVPVPAAGPADLVPPEQ